MPATILFIDDEQYILNSVNRLFNDVDIEIVTTVNADEALNLVNKQEIAVVVADNLMPEMQGTELLGKIKKISPDTMKIMLTGHADLATAVDAINNGEVYRFVTKPWDDEDLINVVTEAVKQYELVKSLKREDEATLLSIAQTIELKDPYTRGHCERVSAFALKIADALGLSERMKKDIKYGSWLHDCGKIGIPERILNSNGPIDKDKYEVIKNHPKWGAEVARKAQLSEPVINIVLYHHERFGGGGYPSGLEGAAIPLEARIVTVADVFDAITTDRPYRKKYPDDKAIKLMIMMKDDLLDPEIVDIFFKDCLDVDPALLV